MADLNEKDLETMNMFIRIIKDERVPMEFRMELSKWLLSLGKPEPKLKPNPQA